ncbi:alpha/beta hydrolase [Rhizorhabdus sp.]|uniref:alpha/beta hydrolase n=1 Tax=Rhizorhabdus sp. TaxID=1968843 RepID=UPI0035ADCB05
MSSRHLVDAEIVPLIDIFAEMAFTPEALSALREAPMTAPTPPDDRVRHEYVTVPGPAGAPDIDLHILTPVNAKGPLPLIYHIHGGGYIVGKASEMVLRHQGLVAELGCALASVEYRLAPETAFPGAIEDCYAGLAWMFERAAERGIDKERVGVMGESAGGGFAAALALLARDRGEYRLAFQHLVYPMLDDRTGTLSEPHPYVGEYVWTASSNRFGWSALLGREPGGDDVSPYAAPARATDLTGLPPAFIYTGALDLFLEEDLDYARRLARAGVPVEFHLFPGAFHGFEMAAESHLAKEASRLSLSALRRFMRL